MYLTPIPYAFVGSPSDSSMHQKTVALKFVRAPAKGGLSKWILIIWPGLKSQFVSKYMLRQLMQLSVA
jgi:hypothetical protein